MPDREESLAERIEEYRRLADVAARRADRTLDAGVKRSYQKLAEGWTALADQVEKSLGVPPGRPHNHRSRRAE